MSDQGTYFVKDFAYDELNGLRRGGRNIVLGPHEHWLLSRLLQAMGDIVSHEYLQEGIARIFAASPHAVHRSIQKLRHALDDTRREVIVSVNRAGYRVGLPVTRDANSLAQPEGDGPYAFPPLEISSDAGLAHASSRLELIMRKDPHNIAASGAYADILIRRMVRGYIRPATHEGIALAAVERTLAIDPHDSTALAAKGWICGILRDDRYSGLKFIEQACRLKPHCARIAFLTAWVFIAEQRLDLASLALARATSQNAIDPGISWLRAWILCLRRQYTAARSATEISLRASPGNDLLWVCDAVARVMLGEKKPARISIDTAARLSPRDWLIQANVGWVHATTAKKTGRADFGGDTGVASQGYASPVMAAILHRAMGDRAASDEFLRIARKDKDPWMSLAWCDPRLHG